MNDLSDQPSNADMVSSKMSRIHVRSVGLLLFRAPGRITAVGPCQVFILLNDPLMHPYLSWRSHMSIWMDTSRAFGLSLRDTRIVHATLGVHVAGIGKGLPVLATTSRGSGSHIGRRVRRLPRH